MNVCNFRLNMNIARNNLVIVVLLEVHDENNNKNVTNLEDTYWSCKRISKQRYEVEPLFTAVYKAWCKSQD